EECKYWPDDEEILVFDDISVTVDSEETSEDYTLRTIGVWMNGDNRRYIKQFHYTSWPDMGVPMFDTGLLSFIKEVRSTETISSTPTVVFCSASVVRTGTYIVIDAMLDMMEVEASVDILGYLKQIRGDRVDMVQTVHQCVCIYNALLEFHLKSVVQFPLSEFSSRIAHLKRLNPVTKTTFIEEEFQ
ncbi:receptor-type tyrosine-protein phosphatase alpha-like, partial [Anneissia japonica]|uniref:receptor-type tyrosine-protein phosphatase alpha-like n=1 Tax=Anneissia japonica TaxID=1529436 RepID=UPI0014255C0D